VTWVIANTKVRSKKSSSGGDLVLGVVLELALGVGHARNLAQRRAGAPMISVDRQGLKG
jgi:hypothetical protein